MKIGDYSGGGSYTFASNLSGIEFRLLEDKLYEGEDLEHDLHGRWLKVETEDFEEGYISAVGELIEELQRLEAEPGEMFEVTHCRKSGKEQTDPYEVNVARVTDPDQSRLSG